VKVIGILNSGSPESLGEQFVAFHRGLREAGYVDGQNVTIECRWANDDYERLPALAKELVDRKVAVLVAAGGRVSALTAHQATKDIPIVFTTVADPVKAGLVGTLKPRSEDRSRSGNLTGTWGLTSELDPKRLELLHEFKPTAGVIGVLVNRNRPRRQDQLEDLQAAGAKMNLRLEVQEIATEREIDPTFKTIARKGVGALLVTADPFFNSRRAQVVALAAGLAVPAIYQWSGFVAAGGLMSYGPSIADAYHQAGIYAGRILGGAEPADLPVVLPTKFDLVINLEKAKAFGPEIRPELLARAIVPPKQQPKGEVVVVSTYTGA
jgi:putative ABC transport system substrate-binding protein